MGKAFKLPDLGEGIHEGEVTAVLVSEGDLVQEGQPILEVETDKAGVEIPSPFTGTVQEIRCRPSEVVKVGSVLIVFGEGEAEGRGTRNHRDAESAERAVQEVSKPGPAAAPRDRPAGADVAPAPAARRDGASRPVGPATEVEAPAAGVPDRGEGPVPASPATRRLAREMGVDLHRVPGSGQAGLVTAEDVRAFAATRSRGVQETPAPPDSLPPTLEAEAPSEAGPAEGPAGPEAARAVSVEVPPLPDFGRWGPVERVPVRSVRRATAKHMALAWSQIPHATHQDQADVTRLEEYRRQHAAEVEAAGGKLTLTVFVMKAVVAALKAFPRLNASLDVESEEIILKRYYHLGVAVDSERGLVVPVIRDVDRKSLAELSIELKRVAERTRGGEVGVEDLQGGTFTITNIGALGGTSFVPIVNYPQVAILGLGRARLQPVVLGDLEDYQIVPRLMLPLVLGFDHRVLDGADAARFTRLVIEALEDPGRLWLRM